MVSTPVGVFVMSALIIVSVFAAVDLSTRRPGTVDYAKANRLRLLAFGILGAVLVAFVVLTPPAPAIHGRRAESVWRVEAESPVQRTRSAGLQACPSANLKVCTTPNGNGYKARATSGDVISYAHSDPPSLGAAGN